MLQGAIFAVGLAAVAAWLLAAISLVRIVLLVPRGKRISSLTASGFMQFQKVRELGGPQVDIHLRRYAWAFATFFFAIVASMFLGMMLSIEAHDAAQSAAATLPTFMPSASLES